MTLWCAERMSVQWCICFANFGMCSPNRTPGTLVGMVPNSPRISGGASGFGSHMSRWLGPPLRKMTMQASAVADGPFCDSFARSSCGSPSPRYDAAPA